MESGETTQKILETNFGFLKKGIFNQHRRNMNKSDMKLRTTIDFFLTIYQITNGLAVNLKII